MKSDLLLPYLSEINNTVGRQWSFRILLELRRVHKIRYNDLYSLLKISSSTLASTLKSLEKQELIQKNIISAKPPYKSEYSLTQKGFEFIVATYPLIKWAIKKKSLEIIK